jgi:hypothetical protein
MHIGGRPCREESDLMIGWVTATDYWRWCWDCGATLRACEGYRPDRKCCPDCRHRDGSSLRAALDEILEAEDA